MSLEAWGDESDTGATCWDDAAMRTDLDTIVACFRKWRTDYASDMPNDEAKAAASAVDDAFSALIEGHMTGSFD